jgi:hypothetical protein
MPVLIPNIPFIGRRKRKTTAATPPAVAPTLVACEYDVGGGILLTFDRAVDVSAIEPTQFTVDDGPSEERYVGTDSVAHDTPTTVHIDVAGLEAIPPGETVTLNAGAGNGIVSTVGGAPWAGASDLQLPYP